MAAEIGPGTLLECIRADHCSFPPHASLAVGRIYTCTAIITLPKEWSLCVDCGDDGPGLHVAEVEMPDYCAWCPCAFRPLPPRSKHIDALLEKLKTPAKVPEPA